MTFLEIVKRLRQECVIAGTGPATVVGQVGEMKRLVDWASSAWVDLQNLHDDWMWLRQDFSFGLVSDVGEYTASGGAGAGAGLPDFRRWHRDTFRLYTTASGVADELWLPYWDYAAFRNVYRFGTQVSQRPAVFTERPRDTALMFGPAPDTTYTCRGEYQRTPVVLSLDATVPEIHEKYHMVIVYHAMISYGMEQGATEVVARGTDERSKLLTRMELEYLPEVM